MGILSKIFKPIKNVFKKIWEGVKTVFRGIMKPISKLLDSKLGKAIMLGVSIFSMGTALLAGAKGFMNASGFINKFVQGGKDFIGSLIGKGADKAAESTAQNIAQAGAEQAAAGAGEAAASVLQGGNPVADAAGAGLAGGTDAVAGASNLVSGGQLNQASGALTQAMQGSSGLGPTKALAEAGKELATRTPPGAEASWLSKAGDFAKDFVTSSGGGNIVGGLIRGAGDYYSLKDAQEYRDRIRRGFTDPNDIGMKMLNDMDYTVDVPTNMGANIAANYNRAVQRPAGAGPSVPFRRTPYQQQPAGG